MSVQKVRHAVDKVLEWIVILIMFVMVLNVLWQVFTRFVLRNPSSFTEELARYLLIWLGLLGASYVAGRRLHLAIDLLPTRLSGRRKVWLDLFINAMIFLFAFFVMVIGGLRLVDISFALKQISAALEIRIGYVYLAVPLSGLFMMFYSATFIWEGMLQLKKIPASSPEGKKQRNPD